MPNNGTQVKQKKESCIMNQITLWYKHTYGLIRAKVEEWNWYGDHQPRSNYFANWEEHDAFRSKLTGIAC